MSRLANIRLQEITVGYVGRHFRLSEQRNCGVFCDENGLLVGGVPLLERFRSSSGPGQWRPRQVFDLNRDLSKRYGLPIDISSKMRSLAAIARALDRGDLVHALIAAPHLQLPDPPDLAKSAPTVREAIDLARSLRTSGLLKADWDPTKHPRWPAGTPGSIGGEFAPRSSANVDSSLAEPSPKLLPVQLTIPAPFEIPEIPLPSEVLPVPIAPPNISPIHIPQNPYPGRPECVKEWADAKEDCLALLMSGQSGKDRYRGMGRTVAECMMGRVSQDCGGNRYDA
jgi:hypothetical protein